MSHCTQIGTEISRAGNIGGTVNITGGVTANASGVYSLQTGSLFVTITPSAAVTAGADSGRVAVKAP